MKKVILGGEQIIIRKLAASDLKKSGNFSDYENDLIREGAYIHAYERVSAGEKRAWLAARFKKQKQGRGIFFVAECEGSVVASARVELYDGSWDHQAEFNIDIARDFRGAGLGKYLVACSIEAAQKEIKPKPVRLILGAMAENLPAIGLYEKSGFKKIAAIPGQHHYRGRFIDEVIMVYYL